MQSDQAVWIHIFFGDGTINKEVNYGKMRPKGTLMCSPTRMFAQALVPEAYPGVLFCRHD